MKQTHYMHALWKALQGDSIADWQECVWHLLQGVIKARDSSQDGVE